MQADLLFAKGKNIIESKGIFLRQTRKTRYRTVRRIQPVDNGEIAMKKKIEQGLL